MQLGQYASMRMEQRQLLTPRMIQSMEILQLPLMALQERVDQELSQNPTLEFRRDNKKVDKNGRLERPEGVDAESFRRLEKLAEYIQNDDWSSGGSTLRGRAGSGGGGERDKKMDALANTAGRGASLSEHLLQQWAFSDVPADVRAAGDLVISYLEPSGYLRTPWQQVRHETGRPFADALFDRALREVQKLDPPGIAARDLKECMLLQLRAMEDDPEHAEGHDFPLETALVRDHLKDLENNRYPAIVRATGRELDEVRAAVRRLGRLVPAPGKLISADDSPPVTPDATITFNEDAGKWDVQMRRDVSDELRVNKTYERLQKDKRLDKATREFLTDKVRAAKFLIEAIQQRRNTLARVIRLVVDQQHEFFKSGPSALRPLPMVSVAEQLGVHVATVSRAVAGKYLQTPVGIFPLRRFFTGGTTSAEGEEMAWDAVREKVRQVVDEEDKAKPLSDDEIVVKLSAAGVDIARRTVAKYRGILNIPTARQRKVH